MSHSTAGGTSSGVHWKQFIAECGIERSALPLATNGTQERLPIRNPDFPQSPRQPLYKEKLRNLPKLRKIESRTKWIHSFFMPRWSNFGKAGICTLERIGEEVRLPNRNPKNDLNSGLSLIIWLRKMRQNAALLVTRFSFYKLLYEQMICHWKSVLGFNAFMIPTVNHT